MRVRTADGAELAADLAVVAGDVAAVAVLCHPHPDHGGDRRNAVVDALFRALPAAGIAAVRFDFRRPVGDGPAGLARAVRDVHAALDGARDRRVWSVDVEPATASAQTRPLLLVGYSFGAVMALRAVAERDDVAAVVAIAPPLAVLAVTDPPAIPSLVLVPAHDQFSPPADVAPVVAGWPGAELEVVASTDHFLAGRAAAVAERAADWLVRRLPATPATPPSPPTQPSRRTGGDAAVAPDATR